MKLPNFIWVLIVIAVVILLLILSGFQATFTLLGQKVTVSVGMHP